MENLNINSNERDFNSLVKQLVHLLPILSVAIIGLGIIKQILYYFYFLVPIKYFLGLSELGLIISDDLIVVVLIFFTCTIFTFVLSKEKKNSKHAKENKFENIDFKSLEKLKKEYKILNISIKSVSSLLFIAAIFYFCLSPNYIRGLYVSSILFFSILLIVIAFKREEFLSQVDSKYKFYILIFWICTVSIIISFTGVELHYVVNGKYKGTKIITSDSTYISNDSIYFIGKTEKYLFIYNEKDTSTIILPSESIKQMILKSK